jgi:hypothetical protein
MVAMYRMEYMVRKQLTTKRNSMGALLQKGPFNDPIKDDRVASSLPFKTCKFLACIFLPNRPNLDISAEERLGGSVKYQHN